MTRSVRTGLRVVATAAWLVVGVPLLVILAGVAGLEPTHWSGTRLIEVELPVRSAPVAAPEWANLLLSAARDQDETDAGDLAPSYWDGDAGQVVFGAVTPAGAERRRRLDEPMGPFGASFRVELRPHSVLELRQIQDAVISSPGATMSSVDGPGDRVLLTVSRVGHPLLADLAAHYGDAVAVRLSPFQPLGSTMELRLSSPGEEPPPAYTPPSWWSRADPIGTWFTLATGFPWYLGAGLLLAAAYWAVVSLRRRRPSPVPVAAG